MARSHGGVGEAESGARGWHGGVMREQQHSSGECTLLGGSSFARFGQQEFGEFPRLVGRYCSYLLPRQDGGTIEKIKF